MRNHKMKKTLVVLLSSALLGGCAVFVSGL